jgi:hypothetical protein
MLSTCLDDIVPTIVGMHWDLIAEDGNRYPYARTQNSALLAALKTKDAIAVPTMSGTYAVFDRRLNLTNGGAAPGGMLAKLEVGSGDVVASDDSVSTSQDMSVTIAVLANDNTGINPATTVESVTQPVNGSAVINVDQTITYDPNAGFTGGDSFTYRATDGTDLSNWATVTVSVSNVNDPPVANPDSYEVAEGEILTVAAPGVLENDSDPDGDSMTAATFGTPPTGLSLNADGSFTYTPAGLAGSIETFDYVANDGSFDSTPATVTLTVVAAPAGDPVANDDFAETTRNTATVIDVLNNDTDAAGAAVDTAIAILTYSQGTRGGTVTVNSPANSLTYEPRRNFRGTETFTYSFSIDGTSSNEATVTVNVVR